MAQRTFSNGVYAQVTLKNEIVVRHNGEVASSKSYYFRDSGSVYDFLSDIFSHEIAAEAESWTELASVGDFYENECVEIEIMDDENEKD